MTTTWNGLRSRVRDGAIVEIAWRSYTKRGDGGFRLVMIRASGLHTIPSEEEALESRVAIGSFGTQCRRTE